MSSTVVLGLRVILAEVGSPGVPLPDFSDSDYECVVFLSSLIGADAGLQLFGLERRAEPSRLDLERQFFDVLLVRVSGITNSGL